MLDYLSIDDKSAAAVTLHETATRAVSRVEGLIGIPAVRSVVTARSDAHGSNNRTRFMDSRLITIDGEVSGATHAAAYAEFDTICQAFEQSLEAPALLKYQRAGGGLQLQQLVKLDGDIQPPLEEGAKLLKYQVELRAADPRAYSQTLTTVSTAACSGGAGGLSFPFQPPVLFVANTSGQASVTNAGKTGSSPLIRLYGYLSAPTLILQSTGERLAFRSDIPAGVVLTIDPFQKTIKEGTVNRRNMLDSKNSTFWDLPSGTSTVRLLARDWDASGHAELDVRDAYRG